MSLVTSLECDACGADYGTTWVGSDEDWIRQTADANGWATHGRIDMCPECRLNDKQLVLAEFEGQPF